MKKEDTPVPFASLLPQHHSAPSEALRGMAFTAPAAETPATLKLTESTDPERPDLEQYIHDRFAREYHANINSFMPYLVMLRSNLQAYAALGFRPACHTRLFLETYLDKPIEEELAAITSLTVTREKIVEVGNLAATKPGSSAPLFGAMSAFFDYAGFEWAVICATPTVQNVFSKLHIPLIRLAEAGESALPDDQKALWGSYYACRPVVMAVHVKTAHRCVRESALGKRLLGSMLPSLDEMLAEWSVTHA